ncbi:MAG: sulfatase-like hydrolase/transferase [Lentisphaerales bacterium]|nr:sulfatase-like hydrolase/transferase [Lentisphaerales bacterium]
MQKLLLVTISFLMMGFLAAEPKKKPNIVLLMTDDQGWGQMGYYNHAYLKTPNLDAMAANGLRMDRFYAANAVCSPTRASVLTGRIPQRTGVIDHGFRLRHQEKTLGKALRKVGYATNHIGKWHLDGVGQMGVPILKDDPFGPGTFGFENWLSMTNFYDMDPLMSRNGVFEEFKGDTSDIAVAEAIKYIRAQHKEGRPSLTLIWYPSPHYPCRALPEDKALFENTDLRKPVQSVLAELVAVDRSVGVLRKELRDLGIEKDTILWFCSDNGGYRGHDIEHGMGGLRGAKGDLYEGGIRVPGIIEWPGRIKPRITNFPACTTDIFPTIASILDLPKENLLQPVDGISLVPLFEKDLPKRDKPMAFFQLHGKLQGYIDNDFKIVSLIDKKTNKRIYELYNIAEDRAETKDLAKEMPEKFAALKADFDKLHKSIEASLKGADYPMPPQIKTVRKPDWVNQQQYEKHFEEFEKRREYQGQIKKWRERQKVKVETNKK